jgi:hypothetical protein
MISPIGSPQSYAAQPATSTPPPAKPAAESHPQDTVSLSPAARGGDVDHDGDSH